MAWLHAVPAIEGKPSAIKPKSRLAALGDVIPPMPKVGFGAHLIEYLFKVGPFLNSGMGATGVSFTELMAWQACCDYSLTAWECETLHKMSDAFAIEFTNGQKHNAPPPWTNEPSPDERKAIAKRIRDVFRD